MKMSLSRTLKSRLTSFISGADSRKFSKQKYNNLFLVPLSIAVTEKLENKTKNTVNSTQYDNHAIVMRVQNDIHKKR